MNDTATTGPITENADIAARFQEYAAILEQQGDYDAFRFRAYREAADHVGALPVALRAIFAH
ncbi:helix-hairpin-helix domain-containing protein [Cypionkella sp.]|jgi:DNA polymerase/3'-5' exonuclease PolX|uniref:helix-hairpin-helix domain-containing protein n=1 Tax=Cypionkella sp. TaxID=2811411 RepID=UPI0027219C92|nr:helix-hairpin-helix domain-containing protein [Cypionkella sp.]MDO8986205.1 helix-hairpin-helix domain-containing protein [Cypionkella sp.]MDP1576854.1 helix-hairpin-helix domain-containing protein [Cypionkella sp.]MDP2050389.1 helix-hairpin-helix domain-containing protein [Cypionkella sp.]